MVTCVLDRHFLSPYSAQRQHLIACCCESCWVCNNCGLYQMQPERCISGLTLPGYCKGQRSIVEEQKGQKGKSAEGCGQINEPEFSVASNQSQEFWFVFFSTLHFCELGWSVFHWWTRKFKTLQLEKSIIITEWKPACWQGKLLFCT